MKNRFIANLAILTLAVAGAFSIGMRGQTTEEGPGPSEQPSAPMEIGQPQAQQPPQYGQTPPADAEAQPGGQSGEGPAKTSQAVAPTTLLHRHLPTPPR